MKNFPWRNSRGSHIFSTFLWRMHLCGFELLRGWSQPFPPTFRHNIGDAVNSLHVRPVQTQEHLVVRKMSRNHGYISSHRATFSIIVELSRTYEGSVTLKMISHLQNSSSEWLREIWRLTH